MPTSSESDSNDRLVIPIACVVLGLLSVGIFLRSRIAAVSALVLYSVTIVAILTQGPQISNPPVPPAGDESSHRS